jgi:hypothetical protein
MLSPAILNLTVLSVCFYFLIPSRLCFFLSFFLSSFYSLCFFYAVIRDFTLAPSRYVIVVFGALLVLYTLFLIIYSLIKAKTAVVRTFGAPVLMSLLFGLLLAGIWVLLIFPHDPTPSLCMAKLFLGHLSFVLIFCSLFAFLTRLAAVYGDNDRYIREAKYAFALSLFVVVVVVLVFVM